MQLDRRRMKFSSNTWTTTLSNPVSATLVVLGGANLFEQEDKVEALNLLVGQLNALVKSAESFANNSVYQDEIATCDGLTLTSVQIETWDRLRIWFELRNSSHRHLGVLIDHSTPVSVYCDSP